MDLEILFTGFLVFGLIALVLVVVIFLPLRWVSRVARRNGRSVSGFCWLFVLFPIIAWPILLTIDKREMSTVPEAN